MSNTNVCTICIYTCKRCVCVCVFSCEFRVYTYLCLSCQSIKLHDVTLSAQKLFFMLWHVINRSDDFGAQNKRARHKIRLIIQITLWHSSGTREQLIRSIDFHAVIEWLMNCCAFNKAQECFKYKLFVIQLIMHLSLVLGQRGRDI